jgi:hypothetical protein
MSSVTPAPYARAAVALKQRECAVIAWCTIRCQVICCAPEVGGCLWQAAVCAEIHCLSALLIAYHPYGWHSAINGDPADFVRQERQKS